MDNDDVRVLLILGPVDDGLTLTWTKVMPRWRAVDFCRDFGASEWYDGSPVGWCPDHAEGVNACAVWDHRRPVLRALIVTTLDKRDKSEDI